MDGGRARILLAEDDSEQRELLGELLELEGYEVLHAQSADELRSLLPLGPRLVLLDLHGVFEPQLFASLRALEPRPQVVILSGDAQVGRVATNLGADGYLAKPYSVGDLLALISNLLSEGAQEQGYV